MKITVYTIKDCAFSKQEKEYLNANKLAYEEKDLETNKSFLTEMLAISNNFAGTPVTRAEKDDGSISVLKGFTKEEFDTTFGFAASPTSAQIPNANNQTTPAAANDTPITIPPVIEVPSTETIPPAPIPTPVEAPVTITPDPLKSVIDNLQSKSEPAPTIPPVEQSVQSFDSTQDKSTTETSPPVNAPTIPDFPAK